MDQLQHNSIKVRRCQICSADFPLNYAQDTCRLDGGPLLIANGDRFIGTTISARFEIQLLLGMGGWGGVYLAKDLELGRTVAVKVLHSFLTQREDSAQRFQKEAELVGKLNHPNIITVYDRGILPNGQPYIVMEYLSGQNLGALIEQNEKIDLKRTASILFQICEALYYAHNQGVIHRDLKPENIVVIENDFVKIVDFGLAKLSGVNGVLSISGSTHGTPDFMSPEQCRGGMAIDARSDIYCLGLIIYYMLSGKKLFTSETIFQAMSMHIHDAPTSLSIANPAISPAVSEIVNRCLSKLPAERFEDCKSLKNAFKLAMEGKVLPAIKTEPLVKATFTARKVKVLAICLAVVCGAAAAYFLGRKGEQQPSKVSLPASNSPSISQTASSKKTTVTGATSGVTSSAETAADVIDKEFGLNRSKTADPTAYPEADADMPTNDYAFLEFMLKNLLATDIRINPDISDERIKQEKFLVFNRDIDKGAMKGFDLPKHIKNLMIENCSRLGDDGMDHIMHLPLEDVNLTGSQVGDLTVRKLLKIKTLKGLVLSLTRITDNAFAEPATNLNHLLITDTIIDDAGCALLPAFKNLEFIDLSGTKITSAGLKQLAKMKLIGLWVSRTGITDSAGEFIASMKHLRTLDISETHVSDKFLNEIARAKNLRRLLIQKCDNVSPQAISAFASKNPDCKIVQEAHENFKIFARSK